VLPAYERPGRNFDSTGGRLAVSILISDPTRSLHTPPEVLCALYGLSPAEARMAWELAQDSDLSHAADKLGITLNTGREYLRRIMTKTGVRRQASLVRLLMAGPGTFDGQG
jgi:DNA-binding CsgD family transcriptional regulator